MWCGIFGANLGLFTFAAAVAAGRDGYVLAVEPDIHLVALLHRGKAVNRGHASVEVVPAAVADDLGIARFHIGARNRSTNHLDGFGTSQAGGIRTTHLVPTITLDWLATQFPPPDVLKIDVEEAEATVLAGAGGVLGTHPRVICEVAARNSATVTGILKEHEYTLYDGNQPAQKREALFLAPHNTLALPAQGRPSRAEPSDHRASDQDCHYVPGHRRRSRPDEVDHPARALPSRASSAGNDCQPTPRIAGPARAGRYLP